MKCAAIRSMGLRATKNAGMGCTPFKPAAYLESVDTRQWQTSRISWPGGPLEMFRSCLRSFSSSALAARTARSHLTPTLLAVIQEAMVSRVGSGKLSSRVHPCRSSCVYSPGLPTESLQNSGQHVAPTQQ